MRATISFETDLDQVEGTMAILACAEEHNLRAAADILSNYTILDGELLGRITEVLRLVEASAAQLRQYQQMVAGFERARFDTILPQPAGQPVHNLGELRNTIDAMKQFDGFVSEIADQDKEGQNDSEPEEG
jgi:hypothetical protein